jgi:hypothetical protein
MPLYNVHLYREMKLLFPAIEAETAQKAAEIAEDKMSEEAESIEDCSGMTISSLVDVVGDEDYSQSVTVDFARVIPIEKPASTLDKAKAIATGHFFAGWSENFSPQQAYDAYMNMDISNEEEVLQFSVYEPFTNREHSEICEDMRSMVKHICEEFNPYISHALNEPKCSEDFIREITDEEAEQKTNPFYLALPLYHYDLTGKLMSSELLVDQKNHPIFMIMDENNTNRRERNGTGRLIVAAVNAIGELAKAQGVNPVLLAERLAGGELIKMHEVVKRIYGVSNHEQ